MAFNPPIPDSREKVESRPEGRSQGAVPSLVRAEKLMQIAFVLPCGMVLGWAAGWGVDHWLHTRLGSFVGLVLGIIGGMVAAIRMAIAGQSGLRD